MKSEFVRSILDKALQRARSDESTLAPAGAFTIRSIHIALGELVDINLDEFRAEWEGLARGTAVENSALYIRRLPAELQCMVCFQKYQPANATPLCPHCGSVGAKVLSGEECRVESIEAEDA
jgi:hydrogenase nickel incorporation protein HypA/HybF